MKSEIKKIIFYLLLKFLLIPGLAQENTLIDKIIATADDDVVLYSELENRYLEIMQGGGMESPGNLRCRILENLLSTKILVAKAQIDSIIIEKKRIDQEMNRRMDYFISVAGSEKELEKNYGKTISQLKEELRPLIKEQMLAQEMQQSLLKDLKITPTEVRNYFSQIPQDSLPYYGSEIEVGQILIYPKVNRTEKLRVKEILEKVRDSILNAGASFQEMAKKYSQDGSSSGGGELGFFNKGDLAAEYEAAALKLKPGEISTVVETTFGFHIIQLIERKGERFNSRHILIKPVAGESDLQLSVHYLDSIRGLISKDSMSFSSAAKKYSEDKATADNGGLFADITTGDTRIPTDKIQPALFFTVDSMKTGSISNPLIFKQDGKTAVRLVWYKSKFPPHKANLTDDYQKIHTVALNNKKMNHLNQWFKKTLRELYISVDEEYKDCEFWRMWSEGGE
ncbi:MAG: hypothetical protein A3H98_14235 [Bacteroidetes bacterium RIFCSPLOWO2_02_FULL_36_8]|nr:MAG: hypothetical protein A3H98_14235 [Bacteroidetes bacterium RIFCSPLOWO2_02_FULL_36_8]OFY69124.1 MAG: hypothetical protein A3G23_06135 [Bacteroidetes bacterium RIFCSPLOWO2_12_FULL_37_12]